MWKDVWTNEPFTHPAVASCHVVMGPTHAENTNTHRPSLCAVQIYCSPHASQKMNKKIIYIL